MTDLGLIPPQEKKFWGGWMAPSVLLSLFQLKIDISEDFLSRNFITFWWNISIFHQQ